MNAVANSWAFWTGLIGALAVLYILPTLIGTLRHVDSLAVVVILNLFPIAWPAALVVACMMPRQARPLARRSRISQHRGPRRSGVIGGGAAHGSYRDLGCRQLC